MDTQRREAQVLEATVEEINAALLRICQWITELQDAVARLEGADDA